MPKRPARDLMVGTFAALALLVVAIAVLAVGGESRVFRRGVTYRVTLPSADGLRAGSPVKMAGVDVGAVRDIRLSNEPDGAGIEVMLDVGEAYAGRIREDSRAALRFLQVLSGEKYVEISPGSPQSPALAAGSTIERNQAPVILEQGADIASNLSEITASLKNILAPLERGEGLLGEMLHDPEFGKEGLARMRGTLENLEALTTQVRSGEGFMGRMLYDREFAKRVDDISRSLASMASAMEAVSRKEGAVGALLEEGGSGEQAIEDFREAAASLKRTALRLESPEGLVGKLLYDREYSETVAADLRRMIHEMFEISAKLNRGQGTLGKLINEPALHDRVENVVAGTADSRFARWLIRHYMKKGIEKEREGSKQQQDPEPEPPGDREPDSEEP